MSNESKRFSLFVNEEQKETILSLFGYYNWDVKELNDEQATYVNERTQTDEILENDDYNANEETAENRFVIQYNRLMFCFHQRIVFLITSLVCVQCVTSSSDKLMWNITSNPVKFGSTAELSCFISDYDNNCTQELRQWIGGQQYTSLCQNMRCSDGTKYHVKSKAPCLYMLMITSLPNTTCTNHSEYKPKNVLPIAVFQKMNFRFINRTRYKTEVKQYLKPRLQNCVKIVRKPSLKVQEPLCL
ncbi:unnamed protein product [Mytilus coruscus]|uniref:Uncharacterized protein n=1 Tax=Mytilus coruscus TaxID=42192 RepID=A0A6J8EBS0_MYTCO|nr:unnamed protein product [Mytilus coruscus]